MIPEKEKDESTEHERSIDESIRWIQSQVECIESIKDCFGSIPTMQRIALMSIVDKLLNILRSELPAILLDTIERK